RTPDAGRPGPRCPTGVRNRDLRWPRSGMLHRFAGFSVHARVRGPASQIQEIGHVKSLWNVAIAVCVGAVAGFVAGVQMHSNGAVGAPLRAENRPAQQPSALPPGSETVYKVILGDPPMK